MSAYEVDMWHVYQRNRHVSHLHMEWTSFSDVGFEVSLQTGRKVLIEGLGFRV